MTKANRNRRHFLRGPSGELSEPCTEGTVRVLRDILHNPSAAASWKPGDIKVTYTFNEPDANGDVYVDFDISLHRSTSI